MHISTQAIRATKCQNDFRICLERRDAIELLGATFLSHYRSNPTLRSLLIPAKVCQSKKNNISGFVKRLCEYKAGSGVPSDCIVVDLCRPYASSAHGISIYDPKYNERSHSNLSTDPSISRLYAYDRDGAKNTSDSVTWCPRPPLEQSKDGPDFVILTRARSQSGRHPLNVEGIAVLATAPVAIRVELQKLSGQWVSVDGGALLRPITNANDRVLQQERNISTQLVIFPEPYKNFLLQRVRITVVECDGKGVRLGLLVSKTADGNDNELEVRGTDIFVDRTESFETEDDYRNWWYRLQSVRYQARRLLPYMLEGIHTIKKLDEVLDRARTKANLQWNNTCCEEFRELRVLASAIIYAVLLLLAFPIMLALNLDQLTAYPSNTTNSTNTTTNMNMTTNSLYTMTNPDPHRTMRTICWQRSTDMDKPTLAVSWSAVFSPFFVSMLLAITQIISRFCDLRNTSRRHSIVVQRAKRAEEDLMICRENVRTTLEAKVLAEARVSPGVSPIVQSIVDDYMAAGIDGINPFLSALKYDIPIEFECLKWHFLDIFALMIGLVATVVYVVADWGCYFYDMDSEGLAAGVLCILVLLCVAMDLLVGVQFVRFLVDWVESQIFDSDCCQNFIIKPLCFALFGVLILQQLLLLLEMFTFFHGVNFFWVFLPLLLVIGMLSTIVCVPVSCFPLGIGIMLGCVALLTSVGLLIAKANDLFGVGTPSTVGLSEMSWVVVMIPIWSVAGGVPLIGGMLYLMFFCCLICCGH